MIPLSGRFYHREKGVGRSVKSMRSAVAQQSFYRPHLKMTNQQSNYLKKLYRGDKFTVVSTRMLFRSSDEVTKFAKRVFQESYVPDRKLFLSRMIEVMGKTKAIQMWNVLTGVDVADSEIGPLLNYHSILFLILFIR